MLLIFTVSSSREANLLVASLIHSWDEVFVVEYTSFRGLREDLENPQCPLRSRLGRNIPAVALVISQELPSEAAQAEFASLLPGVSLFLFTLR